MSNLKFRAWSKKDKTMYELIGFILHKNTKTNSYKIIDIITKSNKIINFDLKDVVLMQAIGLKDINGKDIYEGDILKEKDTGIIFGEVYYMEGIYRCNAFILNLINERGYVIGNIYENKELVENE